jgi:DNA-binding response OmpR family regulator
MDERRVLVIEADSGIRGLIVELLVEAGYAIVEATRGDGGLHLAWDCSPILIVMNHVLPDMSGLDLLDRLRQHHTTGSIPVLLISGRVQQLADIMPSADCVLPLPFDIDVLLSHVDQLAGVRSSAVA